jgi:hypothetical protein
LVKGCINSGRIESIRVKQRSEQLSKIIRSYPVNINILERGTHQINSRKLKILKE